MKCGKRKGIEAHSRVRVYIFFKRGTEKETKKKLEFVIESNRNI